MADHVCRLASYAIDEADVGFIDRTEIKEIKMGSMSIMHWLIVVAVVLLLFGRGKISELMGDVANGIKSFKKGMQEDEPDGFKRGDSKQPHIDTEDQLSAPVARPAHRSDNSA